MMKKAIGIVVVIVGLPIVLCGFIGGAIHHAVLVGIYAYYSFAEWCIYDKKVKENEIKKG